MMDKFLRAKHWVLFLFTYGIPMIIHFIVMGSIFSEISVGDEVNPDIIFDKIWIFPLLVLLFMVVYYGWMYSVAVGLRKYIPEHLQQKLGFFRVALIYPIIYIGGFLFFIFTLGAAIVSGNSVGLTSLIGIILILHLFVMFCMFYCIYFVAKTIKTAEIQKQVRFGEFVGEFLLTWFFPVGVWILQPRINKIVMKKDEGLDTNEFVNL